MESVSRSACFCCRVGVRYAEFLQKKGVPKVKLIEAKDQGHVFYFFRPESESPSLIQKQISDFIGSL